MMKYHILIKEKILKTLWIWLRQKRKSHFQYKSVYKKNHLHFNSPKSTTLRLGITDIKIFDLSILDSRKNNYFGKKRNREMEIVDTIHINGLQNFKTQANISYLVDIEIENDKLWNFAARYKGREFFYRFTIESLLFRPSITKIPRRFSLLVTA